MDLVADTAGCCELSAPPAFKGILEGRGQTTVVGRVNILDKILVSGDISCGFVLVGSKKENGDTSADIRQ